tara:strand:- start:115 stop:819 length:705 start_codon:yes stop_codon:yes gene_type:complete
MDAYELLSKRNHIHKYEKDKIPPKELIDDLLYKTWKTTPSKNNFMPYHVNVLGPEHVDEKASITKKCMANKKEINEDKIPKHYSKDHGDKWEEDGSNPSFIHINTAPYVLVFTQRICEPNPFYARAIRKGDFYEQMHEEYIGEIQRTTSVEIGWFMAHLTALALEQGLDTSTLLCFPYHTKTWNKGWEDIPWVKYPVVLLGSIGYKKETRRQFLNPWADANDKKPEKETVIKWR